MRWTAYAAALASIGATDNVRAECPVYSEPAIFERLSHFKDVGVPATKTDPLNSAMIADASCRLFGAQAGSGSTYGGYTFYNNATAVREVTRAIVALPSTDGPSRLVLTAHKELTPVCRRATSQDRPQGPFDASVVAGSLANWHRALCAGEEDPAWGGAFDPAYQPQQVALTLGFMCMVTCDAASLPLDARAMSALSASVEAAARARDDLCSTVPFSTIDFSTATNKQALVERGAPVRTVCGC